MTRKPTTTGRLVRLDIIRVNEVERLLEWRNDERVYRWCRQSDLLSEWEHFSWWERIKGDPTIRMYAVRSIASGEIVGVAGLTSINRSPHRNAEFSLYIAPPCQNLGYGRDALSVLLSHGFQALGLHVIFGEVIDGNPALDRFLSLGFHVDGRRPEFYWKDGRWLDATIISITEYEWAERQLRLLPALLELSSDPH